MISIRPCGCAPFNIHISFEQTKIEEGGGGGGHQTHLMEPAYCEFLLSRVLF
jgi:hypothetical protein